MKYKTKWYWVQNRQQQVTVVPTCTILHLCLDVFLVKDVHDIPRCVLNINKEIRDLQIHTIYITDYDHDYSIYLIGHRDRIEYEMVISAEDYE